MRRITLLLAAVSLLAVSLAPVVQAQDGQGKGPVDAGGAPIDAGFELLINPGDFPGTCSFPVLLEVDGKGKTIELPNGTFLATSPGLNATLTNPETGTQETYNVTGSVRTTTDPVSGDVVTEMKGRNLAIDPEAGFVVAVGNFSFTFDAEGNLTEPLSGEGQLIDVCEALA